mgnify:FL=1
MSGGVQGVFFRKHTKLKSDSLGLTGWVKNLPDGRVEIVAEGGEAGLNELLDWLHSGSPQASVEGVECEFMEATGEFSEFSIVFS